jgi:signal transduction histidine kinase
MMRELPLLLVLFVCVVFWLEKQLRNEFHSSSAEFARQSGLVAALTLQASMTSHESPGVLDRLEEQLAADDAVDVELVNSHGEVFLSTDSARRGHVYRLTDTSCSPCHEEGSTEATLQAVFREGMRDERTSTYALPLRNTEQCRTCHDSDGEKLGMVFVDQPRHPVKRLVHRTRIALVTSGILAYLFSLLIIGVVLRRYIDLPLRHLLKGAREIGSGNLDSIVELPETGELSVLADTFNRSTRQLREGIEQIKHQRDDLQTLYFIADQLGQPGQPDERRRRAVELVGSIFESDCLLIAGHFHPESRVFHGTLTYRDAGAEIVEVRFEETEGMPEISFCVPAIVDRWLLGELDGEFLVRDGSTVAYPLERRGRRLGLVMAPARKRGEYSDGRATAANPLVVRAFLKHLAIGLELSELRREHVKQERLAAIGAIVAGLSHCLKNTLNGLRGGVYVVERAMENNNAERLEQGWKVLTSSVREIERLSLDMLYFSREHQPKLDLVDPNAVLSEVVDLLTASAANQGIEVRAELDQTIDKMHLDRLAIYRAVLNLASNAVDACVDSEEGGDSVVVRSLATEDEVLISVEDNGAGISERTQKRMFEQFFSTKLGRGTGLGLPVVKKILEEQGGSMDVESTVGVGTTFTIHLPRVPREG